MLLKTLDSFHRFLVNQNRLVPRIQLYLPIEINQFFFFPFQTHLVCTVPPYHNSEITEPVNINVYIVSSSKKSEAHDFVYTPKGSKNLLAAATSMGSLLNGQQGIFDLIHLKFGNFYL